MTSADKPFAIVTGGATGLGLASSVKLLEAGYAVLSLGMDTEELPDYPDYSHRSFDVTDSAAISALAEEVESLDVLVNVAGIIAHQGREFTNDGFDKVMQVNLSGTQQMCFALADALKRDGGGSIINVASMWSIFGSSRNPAYSVSKGAVASLTRALAAAWTAQGVRVNAIAPGWIDTRMSVTAMTDKERAEPILRRIAAGRWGRPEEVGAVVAFLASDAASYVSGVVLPIDGGYSIT